MYRLLSFVKGAALGAGMMYFFDPVVGRRRRALLRDQCIHLANKSCDMADAKYRDLQNRMYGQFAEMRSSMRHDEPTDEVLRDRVRATIGRFISHPGTIEVVAERGVVKVCGSILRNEVDRLMRAIGTVRGVVAIDNCLDVKQSASNTPELHGSGWRNA